jgi:Uma2 family endonuclease
MSTKLPRALIQYAYEKAATNYLSNLPPEHFMESTPQATQREITVESLALVKAQRSEVQYFNELLVQYPFGEDEKIRQVVPDNMVVRHDEPIQAEGSYDLPLQPVRPFWVLEYVSNSSKRKDYDDSFAKYERELKVPYYLLFYPEAQELTLFRLRGKKYVSTKANPAGRYPIPQIELEMALLNGWARFWYQGRLLPLPAELQRELDDERRQRQQLEAQVEQLQAQAERERQEKERLLAQLRALGIEPR